MQDRPTEKAPAAADCNRIKPGDAKTASIAARLDRPVVLTGMMGSGKSRIGRALAEALNLPFIDSDAEIEAAAGCSVGDYFTQYGEEAFREGERRVMARLIDGQPKIIASGGGAVMHPETRGLLKSRAFTVWLQADIAILAARTAGNTRRPLLQNGGDPGGVLTRLLEQRGPYYKETALTAIDAGKESVAETVADILDALDKALNMKSKN